MERKWFVNGHQKDEEEIVSMGYRIADKDAYKSLLLAGCIYALLVNGGAKVEYKETDEGRNERD